MKTFILTVLSLFIFSNIAVADTREEADEIRDAIVSMWAAVERNDVEGYLKFVHPDYTLFGENDIYLQSGKALERESYTDYLARYKGIRTFMHQPQFHIRGDTAWVTYYWSDSGFSRDSGERFMTQGKSTRIFVKENGKWLCIHGHFTSVDD